MTMIGEKTVPRNPPLREDLVAAKEIFLEYYGDYETIKNLPYDEIAELLVALPAITVSLADQIDWRHLQSHSSRPTYVDKRRQRDDRLKRLGPILSQILKGFGRIS